MPRGGNFRNCVWLVVPKSTRGRNAMSRRTKRQTRTELLEAKVARRLEKGYRFHHVALNGSVMPVLARNSVDALSLFNLWVGKPKNYDLGYSSGNCAIVCVSDAIPSQFCMFVGRRNQMACVRQVVLV